MHKQQFRLHITHPNKLMNVFSPNRIITNRMTEITLSVHLSREVLMKTGNTDVVRSLNYTIKII